MDTQTGPEPTECLSCKIIGSTSLAAVGVYALNQSRAHQPGSLIGKRIMAGVGIGFLLASVARWNMTITANEEAEH